MTLVCATKIHFTDLQNSAVLIILKSCIYNKIYDILSHKAMMLVRATQYLKIIIDKV